MGLIFFFEMFQSRWDFTNAVNNSGKVFSFSDSFIWIGCGKLYLFERKWFSSGVNVLTNGLKISDITKKELSQLKFSEID